MTRLLRHTDTNADTVAQKHGPALEKSRTRDTDTDAQKHTRLLREIEITRRQGPSSHGQNSYLDPTV